MNKLLLAAWSCCIISLILMIIGHLGDHNLSWKTSQISTYAARAPLDTLVTAAMVTAAAGLLMLGVLASKHHIAGGGHAAHLAPLLCGAAASGLLMLASFEETAPNLVALKKSGFWAIRAQSFHDAGLFVFFYASIGLVSLLGVVGLFRHRRQIPSRIMAAATTALGPFAYIMMTTPWPKYMGYGAAPGLNQRVALFCLWLGVILILAQAENPFNRRRIPQ